MLDVLKPHRSDFAVPNLPVPLEDNLPSSATKSQSGIKGEKVSSIDARDYIAGALTEHRSPSFNQVPP